MWNPFRKRRKPQQAATVVQAHPSTMQNRYDAADSDAEWWGRADDLSAREANSREIRNKISKRSRYEYFNSGLLKGIVDTRANDTVGTGPRVQLVPIDGIPRADLQTVEMYYQQWQHDACIAEKLRTAIRDLTGMTGEPVFRKFKNERMAGPVKVDWQLLDSARLTSQYQALDQTSNVDGVWLDRYGVPYQYEIARLNPFGGTYDTAFETDLSPAENIVHLFTKERPEQYRGIPLTTSVLTLCGKRRRYRDAVISAAELVAEMSLYFKTTQNDLETQDIQPGLTQPVNFGMGTFVPAGWDASQLKAEQPVTTYDMFDDVLKAEMARGVNMSYSRAIGKTMGYTYASGKIEERDDEADTSVDRSWLDIQFNDRLFVAWWSEAVAVSNLNQRIDGADVPIPASLRDFARVPVKWSWDSQEHLDPAKQANARAKNLASGTTTVPLEFETRGLDAEKETQRFADFLGIDVDDLKRLQANSIFGVTEPIEEEIDQ